MTSAARATTTASVITEDPMVLVGGLSRSGTTLLATVLDAHPLIACGAELIPPVLPKPEVLLPELSRAMELADGRFENAGRRLRKEGQRDLGLFFVRCYRAGVTHEELVQTLEALRDETPKGIRTFADRLLVAQRLTERRARRTGESLYGFKLNSGEIDQASELLPNAYMVCILRDPYDVAASQIARGFDRSIAEIARAWNIYAERYTAFAERRPDRGIVVRYEDLVRAPGRTLRRVFDLLPVEIDQRVFEFYKSDSSIHESRHPNADRLRMNFATDGIGKGREALDADQVATLEKRCASTMEALGYDNRAQVVRSATSHDELLPVDPDEIAKKRSGFKRRRNYDIAEYGKLIEPYRATHEIMRIRDYVREDELGDRKVVILRHDIDHDLENAVRIGEWEHANDLRSTFCLLHTAWYWGRLEDGRYRHSRFLVDCVERLTELGHEINFHNNLVALALQQDVDPVALLEHELAFFDRIGVPLTGTSTHGDRLCRELEFRNWELFSECCDDRFGGPRIVEHTGEDGKTRRVRLGERSMAEFGLEYEAYDYARDVYHTDSGGNLRTRTAARGRRAFGRTDPKRGEVVGILTHCLWWNV